MHTLKCLTFPASTWSQTPGCLRVVPVKTIAVPVGHGTCASLDLSHVTDHASQGAQCLPSASSSGAFRSCQVAHYRQLK
jgi:hypothetical protein